MDKNYKIYCKGTHGLSSLKGEEELLEATSV